MIDKNKIFEDLNSLDGDDIQKKEHFLYEELLEFEKSKKKDLLPLINNYIEFIPAEPNIECDNKPVLKLAADSFASADEMVSRKSEFLLSKDGKFALKYLQKNNEEILITLLAEHNIDTSEILLYLPDLKKYYVSNTACDFSVTGYSTLNISTLNFKAVQYFAKFVISKEGDLYSMVSYNNYANPEIVESSDTFMKVRINSEKECSVAVLINDKNKDFVNFLNGILEIPIMLLSDKTVILLY